MNNKRAAEVVLEQMGDKRLYVVSFKETDGKAPFIQRQRNEKWEISDSQGDIAPALHVNRQKEIFKGFVTSGSKKEHKEPDVKVVYRIV